MQLIRLILVFSLITPLSLTRAASEGENVDPLEPINRAMFAINDGMDTYFIRPLARSYRFVMPDVAERGVSNFFSNLWDANAAVNAVLQGRLGGAAKDGGRFVVNSTFGLLGLFDVATGMGIEPYRTDFGHTLAIWGVGSGPYLMVPFFGPRTLRSGTGTIVDAYGSLQFQIDDVALRNSLYALEVTDVRAGLLKVDELMTGDR